MQQYQARRYRRYEKKKRRRARSASVLTLLVVLAGLGLVGYTLFGEESYLQKAVTYATQEEEEPPTATKSTTLRLTVPEMARVEDLPVYDTSFEDETALESGAQHVQDTGFPNFPWEEEANVYIAGHRLGYPGTDSFLVFYDLDALENGDEIFLTDSDGTRYTYEVFNQFISDPFDWSSSELVPGKNIVTLQTCTLPDYSERLIVQGELTEVEPGAVEPAEEEEPEEEPEEEEEPAPEIEPVPVEPEQYTDPGLIEPEQYDDPGLAEPDQDTEPDPVEEVPAPIEPVLEPGLPPENEPLAVEEIGPPPPV